MMSLRHVTFAAFVAASLLSFPALGADGVNGGVDAAADGSTPVNENGGDATSGGTGGKGGTIVLATTGPTAGITADASGGRGGDVSSSGPAGTGGDGGTIVASVDHPVTGDVSITADGGTGGVNSGTGTNGHGGNGGSVTLSVTAPVTGDVLTEARTGKGEAGATGGTIVIGISSAISGDVAAGIIDGTDHSSGKLAITLHEGATVGGKIRSNSFLVVSNLAFDLTVHSQADFAAANAVLSAAGAGAGGSITVDGRTYQWQGFATLEDLLTLAASIASGQSGPIATSPYLSCRSANVIAYHAGPVIVFNARQPDQKAFFHVGDVAGSVFASANPIGWTVEVKANQYRSTYTVLDAAHQTVAVCKG